MKKVTFKKLRGSTDITNVQKESMYSIEESGPQHIGNIALS